MNDHGRMDPGSNDKRMRAVASVGCEITAMLYAEQFSRTITNLSRSPIVLDYTRESLDFVQEWLISARGWEDHMEFEDMTPRRRLIFIACGCYVGETILRRLGGHWMRTEKPERRDPHSVANTNLVIVQNLGWSTESPARLVQQLLDPIGFVFEAHSGINRTSFLAYFDKAAAIEKGGRDVVG